MAQCESTPTSDCSECETHSDNFSEEARDPKYKDIDLHLRPVSNTVHTNKKKTSCGVYNDLLCLFHKFAKLMVLFLVFLGKASCQSAD